MSPTTTRTLPASCCIAGGGPAGLMLGYLLARQGIDVTVLEKHPDFLRDFRGDTIHPSTLDIIWRLGFLEEFLTLPHQRAEKLYGEMNGVETTLADFSRLPAQCKFIAFMPQWDFLNFIASKAALLPNFRLVHNAQVISLEQDAQRVTGIIAKVENELRTFAADLVVGCDGRNSVVRELAGFEIRRFGAPRDVLWLKINKRTDDPQWSMGHRGPKKNFIMIDRGDYWQCGYSIAKDSLDQLKVQGLRPFLDLLAEVSPFERQRLEEEITGWEEVRLLVIRIDRLKHWAKPGLLCIGDAAHAMSPIGGVGVNLAIQDAVATANIIVKPLKNGNLQLKHLKRIQRRRTFPTWATQSLQIMISRAGQKKRRKPPSRMETWLRSRKFIPFLFGRLIGVGFYREIPRL